MKKIVGILFMLFVPMMTIGQIEYTVEDCKKEAEKGNEEAMWTLAKYHYTGEYDPEIKKDIDTAVFWLKELVKHSDSRYVIAACSLLGDCYEKGAGVTTNINEAINLWFRAYCWGNDDAKNRLYQKQIYPKLVKKGDEFNQEKDYAKAYKCYQIAAEKGNDEAQYKLGFCYENGQGVAQDKVEATKWYQKAADQGNIDAKRKIENLRPDTIETPPTTRKTKKFKFGAEIGGGFGFLDDEISEFGDNIFGNIYCNYHFNNHFLLGLGIGIKGFWETYRGYFDLNGPIEDSYFYGILSVYLKTQYTFLDIEKNFRPFISANMGLALDNGFMVEPQIGIKYKNKYHIAFGLSIIDGGTCIPLDTGDPDVDFLTNCSLNISLGIDF